MSAEHTQSQSASAPTEDAHPEPVTSLDTCPSRESADAEIVAITTEVADTQFDQSTVVTHTVIAHTRTHTCTTCHTVPPPTVTHSAH